MTASSAKPEEATGAAESPRAGFARGAGVVVLAVLAVASVAALPATVVGVDRLWAMPGLDGALGAVLARALGLVVAVVGGLAALETVRRRVADRATTVFATALVALAASAAFAIVGPTTYVGDWQWMIRVIDLGRPLAEWYLAAVGAIVVDRAVQLFVDVPPMTTARIFSALCGGALLVVLHRLMVALGATERGWGWAFVPLTAFGALGVGLGHVEIYAATALVLAGAVLASLRVLETPSLARTIGLGALAAVAASSYIALALIVPSLFVVAGWAAARASRERRVALGAGFVAAFAVALVVIVVLGPPSTRVSLFGMWTGELQARDADAMTPFFHPDDVYWPAFRSLLAPAHWFSGWHLRDVGQLAFLGDRFGLAAMLLSPLLLVGARASLRRAAIVAALLAVPLLAWGFVVVNGFPYPWDWDLTSWIAGATVVYAMLVWARIGGRSKAASALVAVVGIAAAVSGVGFMTGVAPEPPAAFGPDVDGLRLGITPERVVLEPGDRVHLRLWVRNDGPRPIDLRHGDALFSLRGRSERLRVAESPHRRPIVGDRRIEPGETVCLYDFWFGPRGHRLRRPDEGWSEPVLGPWPAGDYEGRLHVRFEQEGMLSGDLVSQPVEIEARAEPAGER
jgi:hypothetical protein